MSGFPINGHAVAAASQVLEAAAREGKTTLTLAEAPALCVGHENGSVLIAIDYPADGITLAPEAAIEMAAQLVRNAMAAGYPHRVEMFVTETPVADEPAAKAVQPGEKP